MLLQIERKDCGHLSVFLPCSLDNIRDARRKDFSGGDILTREAHARPQFLRPRPFYHLTTAAVQPTEIVLNRVFGGYEVESESCELAFFQDIYPFFAEIYVAYNNASFQIAHIFLLCRLNAL